jgi:chemotaxis protein MotA
MDIATIIGILLGFFIVISAIVAGGGGKMFIHLPSLAITMGGM